MERFQHLGRQDFSLKELDLQTSFKPTNIPFGPNKYCYFVPQQSESFFTYCNIAKNYSQKHSKYQRPQNHLICFDVKPLRLLKTSSREGSVEFQRVRLRFSQTWAIEIYTVQSIFCSAALVYIHIHTVHSQARQITARDTTPFCATTWDHGCPQ